METIEKEKSNRRLGIKALIIFGISLILLIPKIFITNLINERNNTRTEAQTELSKSWSNLQQVAGPALVIESDSAKRSISIFPSELNISGNMKTQTLSRGIFNFNVYNAPLTLTGKFELSKETADKLSSLDISNAKLFIALNDLRGLTDNVKITWNGKSYTGQSESFSGKGGLNFVSGIAFPVTIQSLLDGNAIAFDIQLPLKGCERLYLTPVGNTTTVQLKSDWEAPSFQGNFLPTQRKVDENGFSATWKVLSLNRDFGQVINNMNSNWESMMRDCEFGVDLKTPVDQYQQTTRTVKFAFLIIILTFAVIFFEDIYRNANLHIIQYLLIGIAILIFYTLLLSISEHLAFGFAYLIATIMTIGLVTTFLAALFQKNRKNAFGIGGMLCLLYTFLYVLLQLESYALLVGSIALFVILAVAMFATVKLRNAK